MATYPPFSGLLLTSVAGVLPPTASAVPHMGNVVLVDQINGNDATGAVNALPFQTVNGLKGTGGTIDAAGPFAGDGMVFVGSGYSSFGQAGGNVLVAYRPKGK